MLNRGNTEQVSLRLPLPVTNVTEATNINDQSATVYNLAVGAAGTTGSFMLQPAPIASANGDRVGTYADSSLAITAGVTLTTEVPWHKLQQRKTALTPVYGINDENASDLVSLLDNGEFYVVYETGRVFYKKATAGTTITMTHKYRAGVVATTNSPTQATTSTTANVASSASNVTLLALNASRKGATFFNDSTQVLYLKLGATASATSYTVQLAANGYYELPTTAVYTGIIDGIWASANGNCRVTELT